MKYNFSIFYFKPTKGVLFNSSAWNNHEWYISLRFPKNPFPVYVFNAQPMLTILPKQISL